MNRRCWLKTGSLAALGFGLGACAPVRTTRVNAPAGATPTRRLVNLPLIEASWDRVIRTTVGLRPHRDANFVLAADKLDSKMLIHNYGHGFETRFLPLVILGNDPGIQNRVSHSTALRSVRIEAPRSGRWSPVIFVGSPLATASNQ